MSYRHRHALGILPAVAIVLGPTPRYMPLAIPHAQQKKPAVEGKQKLNLGGMVCYVCMLDHSTMQAYMHDTTPRISSSINARARHGATSTKFY